MKERKMQRFFCFFVMYVNMYIGVCIFMYVFPGRRNEKVVFKVQLIIRLSLIGSTVMSHFELKFYFIRVELLSNIKCIIINHFS